MKKKLDTRFPASRIKKIMQADEDVGKIAMAVPVLVSKALELFLQDLCDRTYDITVQRGAKTVSSVHLKHCVHCYNVFDFLKDVVRKVPDYGHSDNAAEMPKRRKVESNDSDEESKRANMLRRWYCIKFFALIYFAPVCTRRFTQHESCHPSNSGRGRGKGRGRGRGRPSKATEKDTSQHEVESVSTTTQTIKVILSPRLPVENISDSKESPADKAKVVDIVHSQPDKNLDLNAGVDEFSEKSAPTADAATVFGPSDWKSEEYPGLSETDRMAIDPVHLAQLSSRLDEDEEDYDEG
ncbi:uncharacterized protein LOC142544221 isoform X1 [Primulina tabacum]|uniref:uncharacterized protein LOC142544221 isoform X1 n=1 Tax=Primulina tabacum TaxID=48773 RepID=UPI003F5AA908